MASWHAPRVWATSGFDPVALLKILDEVQTTDSTYNHGGNGGPSLVIVPLDAAAN